MCSPYISLQTIKQVTIAASATIEAPESASSTSVQKASLENSFKKTVKPGAPLTMSGKHPTALAVQAAEHSRLPSLVGLTRSQQVFSRLTALDPRSLRIETSTECFFFMDLRAERQWASFKMNAYRWASATKDHNRQIAEANDAKDLPTIKKHPRALMDALSAIETKILNRIARGDYQCTFILFYFILWYLDRITFT